MSPYRFAAVMAVVAAPSIAAAGPVMNLHSVSFGAGLASPGTALIAQSAAETVAPKSTTTAAAVVLPADDSAWEVGSPAQKAAATEVEIEHFVTATRATQVLQVSLADDAEADIRLVTPRARRSGGLSPLWLGAPLGCLVAALAGVIALRGRAV